MLLGDKLQFGDASVEHRALSVEQITARDWLFVLLQRIKMPENQRGIPAVHDVQKNLFQTFVAGSMLNAQRSMLLVKL